MTAPDVSLTTPAMVPPSELCAHKATGSSMTDHNMIKNDVVRRMGASHPFLCVSVVLHLRNRNCESLCLAGELLRAADRSPNPTTTANAETVMRIESSCWGGGARRFDAPC